MTAFRRGVEVRVDLAEVNGRAFVNNVSLGIYAAMVRSRHYRRSKVRAALDELPDLIGSGAAPFPLRFHAPDGAEHAGAHALLVSNDPYRLGGLGHSAWRPRLDSGSLGVLTVRVDDGPAAARLAWLELFGRGHLSPGYSRWSAPALSVDADGPMPAGLTAAFRHPARSAGRPPPACAAPKHGPPAGRGVPAPGQRRYRPGHARSGYSRAD